MKAPAKTLRIERQLLLPWLLLLEHHRLAVQELQEVALRIEATVLAGGGADELVCLIPERNDRRARCKRERMGDPSQLRGDGVSGPASARDARAVYRHDRQLQHTRGNLHQEGLAGSRCAGKHEGTGTRQVELIGPFGTPEHPLEAGIHEVHDFLDDRILAYDRTLDL